MINEQSLINSLDFLIEREKNENKFEKYEYSSFYQVLKNILLDSNGNDFAKNVITHSFYSILKSEKMTFSDFIDETDLLNVLNDYKRFSTSFENNYTNEINDIILKFKDVCHISEINNKSEIASYVITEAMIEYSLSTKRFIQKNNNDEDTTFSSTLYGNFLEARKDTDIIENLHNKPYGFYIFRTKFKGMISPTKFLPDYYTVSNQKNGITIFHNHSKIIGKMGLLNNSVCVVNIANKKHDIQLKLKKSDSNDIAIYQSEKRNDFDDLNIINKLIIKSFISLACNNNEFEKIEKENKSIIFKRNDQIDNQNLPAILEFDNENDHRFTFDEMRFTGKYQFMSVLDDILGKYVDMDIVNFVTTNPESHFVITEHENNNNKIKFPTSSTVEDFQSCYYIKEYTTKDFSLGLHRSKNFITPKKELIIGSKKDVLKETKKIAKMNKLALLNTLINLYIEVNLKELTESIKLCMMDNLEAILKDERFLSLITDAGISKSTKANHYNISCFEKSLFLSKEKDSLNDYDENDKMMNYNNTHKAAKLIGMPLYNYRIIDLLVNDYSLELTQESKNIIEIYKVKITLNEMYDEIDTPNKTRINTFCFIDNGIDLELNKWFDDFFLIYLTIPVNNKQSEEFINLMTHIKGADFIQNCNKKDGRTININLEY